jgi:hypothetical protein
MDFEEKKGVWSKPEHEGNILSSAVIPFLPHAAFNSR